jgi:hypothetical protein
MRYHGAARPRPRTGASWEIREPDIGLDLEVMPDGSLLVSDDHAGAIYRIAYRGR